MKTFVRERLVERTVAIDSPIHSNKLQLMKIIKVAKSKSQELKDLKSLATTLCQFTQRIKYVVVILRSVFP